MNPQQQPPQADSGRARRRRTGQQLQRRDRASFSAARPGSAAMPANQRSQSQLSQSPPQAPSGPVVEVAAASGASDGSPLSDAPSKQPKRRGAVEPRHQRDSKRRGCATESSDECRRDPGAHPAELSTGNLGTSLRTSTGRWHSIDVGSPDQQIEASPVGRRRPVSRCCANPQIAARARSFSMRSWLRTRAIAGRLPARSDRRFRDFAHPADRSRSTPAWPSNKWFPARPASAGSAPASWAAEHVRAPDRPRATRRPSTTARKDKAQPLLDAGASWADTPKAVAAAVRRGLRHRRLSQATCARSSSAPTARWPAARPGNVLVDMTTSEPSLAVEIHRGGQGEGRAQRRRPGLRRRRRREEAPRCRS